MDIAGTLQAGAAAHQAGNLAQAEKLYQDVLAASPQDINALHLLGVVHLQQNRAAEAVAFLQRAVALNPNLSAVQFNLGLALGAYGQPAEALAAFDAAVAADPNAAAAWATAGQLLLQMGRHEDALRYLARALAIDPTPASALKDVTTCTSEMGRPAEALPYIDAALEHTPENAELLYARGRILLADPKNAGEVSETLEAALQFDPDRTDLLADVIRLRQYTCNWVDDDAMDRLRAKIVSGDPISPAIALEILFEPDILLANARAHAAQTYPALPPAMCRQSGYAHDRIRVAYLSADFRNHVVGSASIELIERHDRGAFEVIGVSFGPENIGRTRPRFLKAFDTFHDARGSGDADVAQWLVDREVDIAVDLSGYCEHGRPDVFAYRGAPVQISYLGYPHTRGVPFVDYLLGDVIATPLEDQANYVEKVAALPDCYLMSDSLPLAVPSPPTRRAAGLPDTGFVFCAFNQWRKITSAVFDVWMRILKQVPGSILWLRCDDATAQRNLRARALAGGVDRGRLIFAPEVSLELHLARHPLGDLLLDTQDYNAHTTATDSLRAGLPILTCMGRTSVGRLGASILHAAGLSELVTTSLEEYESLAVALAADPPRLAAIRARLRAGLPKSKLLDLDRTARHIESAYRTMVEIARAGEKPRPFTVPRQ